MACSLGVARDEPAAWQSCICNTIDTKSAQAGRGLDCALAVLAVVRSYRRRKLPHGVAAGIDSDGRGEIRAVIRALRRWQAPDHGEVVME